MEAINVDDLPSATRAPFTIGSVVCLVSGGAGMTVEASDPETTDLVWMDGNDHIQRDTVATCVLHLLEVGR